MTLAAPPPRLLRVAAFVAGLAIVAAAVASWRVPAGTVVPGIDLKVSATPTGELEMPRSGTFIEAHDLKPGTTHARAAGKLAIRNQTGTDLSVRVKAAASSADLDELLQMKITAGDRVVAEGSLESLSGWSKRALRLPEGTQRTLTVEAGLPDSAGRGYQGRIADVSLVFDSKPAGQ